MKNHWRVAQELTSGIMCVISITCGTFFLYLIATKRLKFKDSAQYMIVCLSTVTTLQACGYLEGVLYTTMEKTSQDCNSSEKVGNYSSYIPDETNDKRCKPNKADEILCRLQSSLTTWSSIASFFFTIGIEIYCFRCLHLQKNEIDIGKKWKTIFSVIAFGVPSKFGD